MSIKLEVKEYCQNCPGFEPEANRLGNTTYVICKDRKRCDAQMRYLQKQHDEMKKKETGDESDKVR